MPFLLNDNTKLHYKVWEAGNGPWITLVNGHTRTLNDFRGFGDFLASKGFRVLTFDNRGAGGTECPDFFTLDEMVLDIAVLWEHLSIGKSALLGVSMGGVIAAHFAKNYSEKITKLFLISTPMSSKRKHVDRTRVSKEPKAFMAEMLRYFSPKFLKTNKLLVEGFARQAFRIYQEPSSSLGAQAQREAVAEFDLASLLPQLKVPTLILHGESDLIVPPVSATEILSLLPNAQLEVWPDTGHLLLAECPEQLYKRIADFLAQP